MRYWRHNRRGLSLGFGLGLTHVRNRAGGGTIPTALSGLQLWLDADGTLWQDAARSTPATANDHPVGAWDDASGNARHFTQGTAGSRPLLKTAGMNGLKCLRFNGTTQGMLSAALLSTMIAADAYTLFAVFQTSAVDTNSATIYQNDAVFGDNGSFFGMHLKSVGPTVNAYNFDTTIDTVGDTIAVDTAYCVTQRHSAGNLTLRVNNGTQQSVASGNTGGLAAVVLVGRAQSAFLAGDVRHLVIYNEVKSAAEEAAVRAWLMTDSGIA